ncbi:hypothetical protein L1047_00795 [Synechococcus sp. Nb3U1]|nr:hypothetical protein [Synechococcus sp. Nb3U1]
MKSEKAVLNLTSIELPENGFFDNTLRQPICGGMARKSGQYRCSELA